jgi:hypothetical protein
MERNRNGWISQLDGVFLERPKQVRRIRLGGALEFSQEQAQFRPADFLEELAYCCDLPRLAKGFNGLIGMTLFELDDTLRCQQPSTQSRIKFCGW